MNQIESIPSYGKLYLLCSVLVSLLVFTKSIDPYSITYTFKTTLFELNLWRPFTAILYLGRINILLPFQFFFAFLAFRQGTARVFGDRKKADFVWTLILSVIMLSVFSTFINLYFYANSFIMILLMMWAVQYPTDRLTIGSLRLPSIYIPVVYAVWMVLLGSSFKNYMAGFLFGLLLGVVKSSTYTDRYGELFPIPNFIKSYFQHNEGMEQIRLINQQTVNSPRN